MTTGIPLLQPAPPRVAAQSRAAQLSPQRARIDAPEPREFDATLREASKKSEARRPDERPGEVERPGEPVDDKKAPDPKDKDGDHGVTPDSTGPDDAISQTPSPDPGAKDAKAGGEGVSNEPPKDAAKGDAGGDTGGDVGANGKVGASGGPDPKVLEAEGAHATPVDAQPPQGATNGQATPEQAQPVDPPAVSEKPGAGPTGGKPTTNGDSKPDQLPNPGAGADRKPSVVTGEAPPDRAREPAPGSGAGERAREITPPPPTDHEAKLRLDESIRAQVRRPARVNLDELAAEQLATPTRTSAGRAHTPGGALRWEHADAAPPARAIDSPPEPATPEQVRPAAARAAVVTQAPARQDEGRAERPGLSAPGRPEGVQSTDAASSSSASSDGQGKKQGGGGAGAEAARVVARPSGPGISGGAQGATFRGTLQDTPGVEAGGMRGVPRTPGAEAARAAVKSAPAPRPDAGETAQRVMAQVSRGVASVLRHQGGSLTLRLSPRSLGELRISMRMEGGGVRASFRASDSSARELLQNNLDSLRTTLEQHGVRVERLSVEDEPAGTRDAPRQHAEDPRSRGDGSPGRDSPAESGGDGRSPGDQRHGGRSDGRAGGGPWAIQQGRAGAGRASDDAGGGVTAAGDSPGARLGLDTLA